MHCTVEKAKIGDEEILAQIHVKSWKSSFKDILSEQILKKYTDFNKTVELYRHLIENGIGHGYLLTANGIPHCLAWWNDTRDKDMPDYAEIISLQSVPENRRNGLGGNIMNAVLDDILSAGYSKVMLWVFEENIPARCFYEKHGFHFNGKTKCSFGAKELCYEKILH